MGLFIHNMRTTPMKRPRCVSIQFDSKTGRMKKCTPGGEGVAAVFAALFEPQNIRAAEERKASIKLLVKERTKTALEEFGICVGHEFQALEKRAENRRVRVIGLMKVGKAAVQTVSPIDGKLFGSTRYIKLDRLCNGKLYRKLTP